MQKRIVKYLHGGELAVMQSLELIIPLWRNGGVFSAFSGIPLRSESFLLKASDLQGCTVLLVLVWADLGSDPSSLNLIGSV